VASVSEQRWEEAQDAERAYWDHVGFPQFRRNLEGAMGTAEWARPNLGIVGSGDWLAVGLGPLGISCTHFLRGEAKLLAVDPIEPIDADAWQLPEPCKALLRAFQETTVRHVGRGEALDFPDDAFAVVSIENTLDHVQDPAAVLAEARRVLEPGGRLILTVDTFSTLGEARFRLVEARRMSDSILVRAHPHRFSAVRLVRLVHGAGFRVAASERPSRLGALVGRHSRMRIVGA
jgi:SAM-dependent methyltransferase